MVGVWEILHPSVPRSGPWISGGEFLGNYIAWRTMCHLHFYTSWHHDSNDVENIINYFWGFIHLIQIFHEFKHYPIGAAEPLSVAFIVKWYSSVCPWKGRLTGFELQRRKTLSQPPSSSISLGNLAVWIICVAQTWWTENSCFNRSYIRANWSPSFVSHLWNVFFSSATKHLHDIFQFLQMYWILQTQVILHNTHKGYPDIIYPTNLYNKNMAKEWPMEEFFRNGCRSTQPAIWRSLRGVMESATCCRTTRHRGMATLSRFQ